MSLRLVRCPFCGKRFNVQGIDAGTRLRCGWCTAVLAVPHPHAVAESRSRGFSRTLALQVGGGIAAGLVAAVALYVAMRPSPPEPVEAPVRAAAAKPGAAPAPSDRSGNRVGFIPDPVSNPDPVSKKIDEIYKEFDAGFTTFSKVKPYLLAFEPCDRTLASREIADYAKRLETLHAGFRREFAVPLGLPEVDAVLAVIVLNSRESFDRYCLRRDGRKMAPHIKGIYEYDLRRIVVYFDTHAPYEVLFHEGVHQLVHFHTLRAAEGRPPQGASTYWFQEGLGTYFEGFRQKGDEVELDPRLNRSRLPIVKQSLQVREERGDFIPLGVLVGTTVDEFWQWFERLRQNDPAEATRKAQLYYAESWALVYFLRESGENHRKAFDAYFREELSGFRSEAGAPRHRKDVFEALVREHLGKELHQLEEEFVEFIRNLK